MSKRSLPKDCEEPVVKKTKREAEEQKEEEGKQPASADMLVTRVFGDESAYLASGRLSAVVREKAFRALKRLPLEERPPIFVYGKRRRQRRDVGFFANGDVHGYRYSGQTMAARPVTPELRDLLAFVNSAFPEGQYNGMLVNRYRDGKDYVSSHADSEDGLGKDGAVVSISFGAERIFRVRAQRKQGEKGTPPIVHDQVVRHGDVLIMSGGFQAKYLHEIPVQKKAAGTRISVTFRKHVSNKLSG